HGVTKDGSEPAREQEESGDDAAPAPEGGAEEGEQDALTKYALNPNERARAGDIETLEGRVKEMRCAIQAPARRVTNNPLFVGDAGDDKTGLVGGVAAPLLDEDVRPTRQSAVICAPDIGTLVPGTKFRGHFACRFESVCIELGKR